MSDEEKKAPSLNHPRQRHGKTSKWRAKGSRPQGNFKEMGERGHLFGKHRPAWVKQTARAAKGIA